MIPLITDNQGLAAYCQQVRNSSVLALDTEFIRQSTLYPKLGLIQLYDGQTLALVDPLAISDWQPLQQIPEPLSQFQPQQSDGCRQHPLFLRHEWHWEL